MRLTADLDIGKQNLVANFAHQMGVSIPSCLVHRSPANKRFSMRGACIMSIKTQLSGHLTTLLPAEMSSVLQISNART